MTPAWSAQLAADAPDVVACWQVLDGTAAGLIALRRELRRRVRTGDAQRLADQQQPIADRLERILHELPEPLLRVPGGEANWNVAQAFAHTTAARRFLATWAALDAGGSWPSEGAPRVIPSVPGPPDADRERLLTMLVKSRRAITAAAERISGHETQRCGMDHPLVGRLRCGDWLLFVGVHDLMHLEQLHALRDASGA